MANHKRKKPKHQRAGCIMCKPWKDERGKNGNKGSYGHKQLLTARLEPVPTPVQVEKQQEQDRLQDQEDSYDAQEGFGSNLRPETYEEAEAAIEYFHPTNHDDEEQSP